MTIEPEGELSIKTERDILAARHVVRAAVATIGFGQTEVTRIVTAASELARNVFKYGGEGVMRWKLIQDRSRHGIELQFVDNGPGIENIELAMTEGFSSGGGLGMGLPGAKRLVDEFSIRSAPGAGTTVAVKKWHKK